MRKDITDLTRKSRLVEYFSETPRLDTTDTSLVKNISNFCSSQKRNSTLEYVIEFLQKPIFSKKNFQNKSNISNNEWKDNSNLKQNKDIIKKSSSKGGAIVIMNTKHYLYTISDHLNDEAVYKMVESNCDDSSNA